MTKRRLHRPIKRNVNLLAAISFFIYLFPYTPIAVILFEELTGSYIKAMSVFALMGITAAILEIPSGVISDKWGRHKTLTLGCFLSFINVVCITLAFYSEHSLWLLYAAALFQGAAESLYSGNNEALIYETLATLKRTHTYPKVLGRMSAMTQGGLALSGLIGGLILLSGFPHVSLLYVSLLASSILVLLCFFIVAPRDRIVSDSRPLKHVITALRLIKKNEKLRLYSITNMIAAGAMSSSYYFTPGFIGSVWPAWATPIFRTGQHLIGTIGFWHAGRVIKTFGAFKSLLLAPIISDSLSLIAYWTATIFSPFMLMLSPLSYSTWQTAKSTIEQEAFTKEQRATMGSLINFGASIVSATLAIGMGWLADRMSMGMTLFIVLACRSAFCNGSYAFLFRKFKK